MIDEIKAQIIKTLNLEDLKPDDIKDDEPLFVEGLGLDSVDALELGLMVEKRYGIVLDPKKHDLKAIYYSPKTLADFIQKNRSK